MWRRPSSVPVFMCILLIAAAYTVYWNLNLFKNNAVISPEEKKEKKYVILAGPGKTASTSIQFNLYKWSESGWLGHDWAWMQPNLTCLREQSRIYCPSFQYVLFIIHGTGRHGVVLVGAYLIVWKTKMRLNSAPM
jgi:hypothetical protein